ncbi:hypothetical protein GTO91_08685 [Heliobacterium undosum]|uniref:adenosine deaminase n=1 Tax=Heliomicrobium undosum TaxID=121734 RepID=A0A845L551_9FIRM|nr:hypothetical protein [Heliomicrobium undosum]MZP29780.1 hypothetical protein [Heliomicrobium undosum]
MAGDRHPLPLYRRAGVPITLNTDDEGINRSNLTMEYVKAVNDFQISYRELKEFARNSLEYSFLPGKSLYIDRNYNLLQPPFAGIRQPGWHPNHEAERMMAESEKLTEQVRLERSLYEFEDRRH